MEVVLATEEQIVNKQSFTTSFILFWQKTDFTLTNKRIIGENPNTLLGLIPLGKNQITMPLKNISGVSGSNKFHLARFLLGVVVTYLGIKNLGSSFLPGIVFSLFGIATLLNSYVSTFIISNNSGQTTVVELSFLEKAKVSELVTATNHKIAEL